MPDARNNRIDASPTKEFFIFMLTKDIGTTRAILDLVDNSIDGAKSMRPKGDWKGLYVKIVANPKRFVITDNCGGISIDVARNYAFRFGRSSDAHALRHSIGQFGVGMKRALFKLGKKFKIESATTNSRFVVEEDVEKWQRTNEWEFNFREREENRKKIALSETGTTITVSSLNDAIAESFSLDNFQNALADELADAHVKSIANGLEISLNQIPLKHHKLVLLNAQKLKPAHKKLVLNGRGHVDVNLYAGIGDSSPSDAGWYVFCNDRLILSADRSKVTGWGETREATIPFYHNQFARFRGYVFFSADQTNLLPWNTTKTGVDADSPRYRATRLEMVKMMRPVIDFLNRLDAEKDAPNPDEGPLQELISESKPTPLDSLQIQPVFSSPKSAPIPQAPEMARIQYKKPLDKVERVKKTLKVTTLRAVGEKTFDYYFKNECEA
jgi:hypothetical protein